MLHVTMHACLVHELYVGRAHKLTGWLQHAQSPQALLHACLSHPVRRGRQPQISEFLSPHVCPAAATNPPECLHSWQLHSHCMG